MFLLWAQFGAFKSDFGCEIIIHAPEFPRVSSLTLFKPRLSVQNFELLPESLCVLYPTIGAKINQKIHAVHPFFHNLCQSLMFIFSQEKGNSTLYTIYHQPNNYQRIYRIYLCFPSSIVLENDPLEKK